MLLRLTNLEIQMNRSSKRTPLSSVSFSESTSRLQGSRWPSTAGTALAMPRWPISRKSLQILHSYAASEAALVQFTDSSTRTS
jgi:hypothetical protein